MRLLALLPAVHALHCPEARPGSTRYEYQTEKCIYVYDQLENGMNWVDADTECQQIRDNEVGFVHGELVTIHSEDFNYWLYQQLTKQETEFYVSFWIGLRSKCVNCPLTWNDNSPLDYEDWRPGEPNGDGVENCVELHTTPDYHTESNPGMWNDHNCGMNFRPICHYFPNNDPWHQNKQWPKEGGCPSGWEQFAGNCYITPVKGNTADDNKNYKQFSQAQAECKKLDTEADLAVIISRFHQAWVNSMLYLDNHRSRLYVGVVATLDDHYFHYSTGEPLAYSNWAANKPDSATDSQRCVVIEWHPEDNGASRHLGDWDDSKCTTFRPYICSMPVKPNLPPLPLPNLNDCPEGYISWGVACYQLVTEMKTFPEAKQHCESQTFEKGKSFVTSIVNDYENSFIYSFFGSDAFDRVPPPEIWIGLEVDQGAGDSRLLSWSDKTNMDYTSWDERQPSNQPGLTAGVMDYYGKWALWNGDIDRHAFICKYNPHHEEIIEKHDYRGELQKCESYHHGSSWTEVGEICVKGFKDKQIWAVGEDYCQRQYHKAHLVSIHSMQQNTEILHEASRLSKDPVWIGMTRSDNLGWQWTDRSAVSFEKWEPGYPNNTRRGEADCTVVNQKGNWMDVDCSKDKYTYICSHGREWSNCMESDAEKQQCGYEGISESECEDVWKCCYDPRAQVQCFMALGDPNRVENGKSGGMSNAGAVFLTMFMFALPMLAFVAYSKMSSSGSGAGFSNPMA